jgi:hypothetical protein
LTEKLSPQQVAAFQEGYRQGVSTTYQQQIKRIAAVILAAEAAQIAADILSKGPRMVLSGLGSLAKSVLAPRWARRLDPILDAVMTDAVAHREPVLGVGFDRGNPFMAQYFDDYLDRISHLISDVTAGKARDEIQKALDEGLGTAETAQRVQERLEGEIPTRSERIAATELQRAVAGANYLQAAESGFVVSKTHHHQNDDRVRPEHHFVETVPIHEPYQNGEYHSGQFSVGCRCHDEYTLAQ